MRSTTRTLAASALRSCTGMNAAAASFKIAPFSFPATAHAEVAPSSCDCICVDCNCICVDRASHLTTRPKSTCRYHSICTLSNRTCCRKAHAQLDAFWNTNGADAAVRPIHRSTRSGTKMVQMQHLRHPVLAHITQCVIVAQMPALVTRSPGMHTTWCSTSMATGCTTGWLRPSRGS